MKGRAVPDYWQRITQKRRPLFGGAPLLTCGCENPGAAYATPATLQGTPFAASLSNVGTAAELLTNGTPASPRTGGEHHGP